MRLMKTIFRLPGLNRLLFAQSQVAFNDNAVKLVLIGLVQLLLPADEASSLVSLIALLLVAPFLLFAPLTGWLADRFPNRDVVAWSLLLQLGVMVLLFVGTLLHSLPIAVGGFFLLGLQSALMSPARRGLVKNLAGERVGEAIGWMEMLCIVAILGGSLAGGQLIDGMAASLRDPWKAAGIACAVLGAGCIVAYWLFLKCPRHPAPSQTPFSKQTLFGHVDLLRTLRADRSIWWAAIGDSAFYLAGGVLMLTFADIGRLLHPSGLGAARATGIMMALLGGGIAVGSIVAARMSRHQVNLGLVPVGAFGMAVVLGILSAVSQEGALFQGLLVLLGICGGLFLVPLGAFLVDRSPTDRRGKILAASSMISSFTGLVAVGLHMLMTKVFGLSPAEQFIVLGVLLLVVAMACLHRTAPHFLRLVTLLLCRNHYIVKTVRSENLPRSGGALIVCNHVSYVDTIVLSLASPRPIRFLSYEAFFKTPVLGSILRIFGAIPVSSTRARAALSQAADHIRRGELVCIFPEGQLTRTGTLQELKSGFEIIARRAKAPVIVAQIDGLWGSIHSFEGGRYFTKWPKSFRRNVTVSFASPMTGEEATTERVRQTMLELGAEAFTNRKTPLLSQLLSRALLRNAGRVSIKDETGNETRAAALWLKSLILGGLLRDRAQGRRVGVILPPGPAAAAANLALIFTGRVPVNLNPLVTSEAAMAAQSLGGIRSLITSRLVRHKLPDYPWPEDTIYLEEFRKITWMEKVRTFARGWMASRKAACVEDEAILLFTSGSSGLPKGVPLTHRNIVANLTQVRETSFLQKDDGLLSSLPLFHSFGLVMGLFLPLACGRRIVTSLSPLDCEKLSQAARSDAPTVLLSTPTFLKTYIRRIPRDAFGTLRMAVTGAEKLPSETAAAFRDRFGCEVTEGYGLTETSPVACLNVPHPAQGLGANSLQTGWREGSVGRLVPGLAVRFYQDDQPLTGASRGILGLKGANVLSGYLGDETGRFDEGWFITGDVAHMDSEGFIHIEGRQSHFSKIGGEMVSHVAVEQAILRIQPDAEALACVIGVPCPDKGERLVLLTNQDLSRETIRAAFASQAIPNLWLPRDIVRVKELPLLASGKLDVATCRQWAQACPVL